MRNLLALFGLVVVAFLVIGWHQGWYSVKSTPTTPGHNSYNVDINTKKVGTDVQGGVKAGADKVHGWLESDKK